MCHKMYSFDVSSCWCHDTGTLSMLMALCEGNPLITCRFLLVKGQLLSASSNCISNSLFSCDFSHLDAYATSLIPESKVHGANMGPIWGRQDPGGPHVGPVNFAIWDMSLQWIHNSEYSTFQVRSFVWIIDFLISNLPQSVFLILFFNSVLSLISAFQHFTVVIIVSSLSLITLLFIKILSVKLFII